MYFDKANALVSVTYASTFGIVSLALAVIFVCTRRLSSMPPDFVLFLAATSTFIIVSLFISRHHPAWLFYPALLVWELLLPFLVMDGIRALPQKGALQTLVTRERAGTVLAAVYMAYQVWLFHFRVF
jgi:branched-subunit amino acid ABC-type transport system permease component